MCCCRGRQGTGQAARAGRGWGQRPLRGSTQACRVLVDRPVLLSFSCLYPQETGAWAGGERKDEREGRQIKYLFIKCFVISQLDAAAWCCSWAGHGQAGSGVCSQIRSSCSPFFTSHLPGVWASGRQWWETAEQKWSHEVPFAAIADSWSSSHGFSFLH